MQPNERIRAVRTYFNLTQFEFGDKIGLKQNTVGQIESGSRGITDRTIILISQSYGVNDEWLRTGTGEMLKQSNSTVLSQLSAQFNLDDIDRSIISSYLNLGDFQRKVIKDFIRDAASALYDVETYQVSAVGGTKDVSLTASDRKKISEYKDSLLKEDDSDLI